MNDSMNMKNVRREKIMGQFQILTDVLDGPVPCVEVPPMFSVSLCCTCALACRKD